MGGQAVRLYGSERVTQDYDLWFESSERRRVLSHLERDLGLELSAGPDDLDRPIVTARGGLERLDAFFVRGMTNRDGLHLDFEEVATRARTLRGSQGVSIRVPDLDDLIALKRMRPVLKPEDETDLRYLLVRKQLEATGGLPKPH
jgi:hypothetical protein